jgi:Fur family ferric uptake transcriptional regulator
MTKIGQRFTRTRKNIFEAIEHFNKPVSVQDIFSYLKKQKEEIDLTSIYRNLELMRKAGIVDIILFGEGKKRYELKIISEHHHHLVCEKCGDVEDIEMQEKNLLKDVEKQSKFKVLKHSLEFFGLCQDCQ